MQSIASAVIFRRNNHLNHMVILLTIFIAIYLNFNNINITFFVFFWFLPSLYGDNHNNILPLGLT
ncbi:hypothetical protein [Citrobacter freundii]|uniref:Uncharacterized protein n=1 Tax=Citrobacter freundii TaxID=546 RepID=A0A7G2IHM6_CITFR|nr:hypothetical protein [Citrobacter freundii]